MFKLFIRSGLGLLVLSCFLTSCEGFRNGGDYDIQYENGYKDLISSLRGSITDDYTGRGIGLTAWEIIIITVLIILAIVAMYYISICYPVLCQKTRKFDKMGEPIV